MQSSCLPLYMCTVYGLLNFVFLVALHHQKHYSYSYMFASVMCSQLSCVLLRMSCSSCSASYPGRFSYKWPAAGCEAKLQLDITAWEKCSLVNRPSHCPFLITCNMKNGEGGLVHFILCMVSVGRQRGGGVSHQKNKLGAFSCTSWPSVQQAVSNIHKAKNILLLV